MMWNGEQIREVRLRLGWTVAEMSRRLGCSEVQVKALEANQVFPDAEVSSALQHLAHHVENNSEQLKRSAQSEEKLKGLGVDQVHVDDLLSPLDETR